MLRDYEDFSQLREDPELLEFQQLPNPPLDLFHYLEEFAVNSQLLKNVLILIEIYFQ